MKIYTKQSVQNLPITLNEAWDFLSDPKKIVLSPVVMSIDRRD
jgi:hypothetical protein